MNWLKVNRWITWIIEVRWAAGDVGSFWDSFGRRTETFLRLSAVLMFNIIIILAADETLLVKEELILRAEPHQVSWSWFFSPDHNNHRIRLIKYVKTDQG